MIDLKDSPKILRDFIGYLETQEGKPQNTLKNYLCDLRVFLKFLKIYQKIEKRTVEFDSIDISNITIKQLQQVEKDTLKNYMAFLKNEKGNAAKTRARRISSLKCFFNYLMKEEKCIEINYANELRTPKIPKRLPKFLTKEECIQLLKVIDGKNKERDYCIITFFINCGIRLSELANIKLKNIKDDTLTVIGKGDKERAIPLTPACLSALENYLVIRKNYIKKKQATNILFLSNRGMQMSSQAIEKLVNKYLKIAGFESMSTHKLRHTAATLMYQSGDVDLREIQSILGHQSLATTEIYTHLDMKQLKKAVNSNPLANFIKE